MIYIIFFIFFNNFVNRKIIEGQLIEIIWTIIPILFLIFLAIPSLKILYLVDELNRSDFSIKVLGHQWYWRYEYNDFKGLEFDSFIINNSEEFRLLDVDNYLILPKRYHIRLLVNSIDVIHSFAVPRLGIKIDAVPGRINQVRFEIERFGLYYGQCSEICGVNHRFIPIVIESTRLIKFLNWIKNF